MSTDSVSAARPSSPDPRAVAEPYDAWRQQRSAYVTSPVGNLALVGYQPVRPTPVAVQGLPIDAWRSPDEPGVWIAPHDGAVVAVDDEAITGETFVDRLRPDGTPVIRVGLLSADVFSLDGTDYELRIYDSASANLESFVGIEAYDHDPAFVTTGRLEAFDETTPVAWDFTRATDSGHAKQVPGLLRVQVKGESYGLMVFLDGDDLVLVFADATTGRETYAPGRFLKMRPAAPDGTVDVDFNRAIIPPCGFSDFYSCPIPPAQNRINAPVRAGEKSVRWKTPRY